MDIWVVSHLVLLQIAPHRTNFVKSIHIPKHASSSLQQYTLCSVTTTFCVSSSPVFRIAFNALPLTQIPSPYPHPPRLLVTLSLQAQVLLDRIKDQLYESWHLNCVHSVAQLLHEETFQEQLLCNLSIKNSFASGKGSEFIL